MTVDRPKAAEKLLREFVNQPPVYHERWVNVYDDEPGGEVFDQVLKVEPWNACDNYYERWLSPTWYTLTLHDDQGQPYDLAWARATHDRGGLELPKPGPWRFKGGTDHWECRVSVRAVRSICVGKARDGDCGWCGQAVRVGLD